VTLGATLERLPEVRLASLEDLIIHKVIAE